jgi:hypothetical protein
MAADGATVTPPAPLITRVPSGSAGVKACAAATAASAPVLAGATAMCRVFLAFCGAFLAVCAAEVLFADVGPSLTTLAMTIAIVTPAATPVPRTATIRARRLIRSTPTSLDGCFNFNAALSGIPKPPDLQPENCAFTPVGGARRGGNPYATMVIVSVPTAREPPFARPQEEVASLD